MIPIYVLFVADLHSRAFQQANPKLADRRDDDERLPIHWAVSQGHLEIATLLSAVKNFDPDVQVGDLHSVSRQF